MSKSLQWVIGIGVVLVVAAVIVSSAASFFSRVWPSAERLAAFPEPRHAGGRR
jgi:hypothetical protein